MMGYYLRMAGASRSGRRGFLELDSRDLGDSGSSEIFLRGARALENAIGKTSALHIKSDFLEVQWVW